MGFLGPKVYEALDGRPFPPGVQTAENLAARGVIDAVVPAEELRALVDHALAVLVDPAEQPVLIRRTDEVTGGGSAWEAIGGTRDPERAGVRELLRYGATRAVRLRGTEEGERDATVVVALTRLDGQPCVVVGQDRSRQAPDNPMGPAALREARRAMRLAEELGLPLVTVIDTPGSELSPPAHPRRRRRVRGPPAPDGHRRCRLRNDEFVSRSPVRRESVGDTGRRSARGVSRQRFALPRPPSRVG